MQDKLIGYLLGALDLEECMRVEELLESDSEARGRLEVLRVGLIPFEGDRGHVEAPTELARRTCERIRNARGMPQREEKGTN